MTRMVVRSTVAALLLAGPAYATTETPSSSLTVRSTLSAPAVTSAQNGISGPLQGPLASPLLGSGSGCCPCRTVHRVRHARVAGRPAPVRYAEVPLVPLVPLIPYRPVYVYRPLVVYRPVVPFVAYRPFFFRPYYYGRGFY